MELVGSPAAGAPGPGPAGALSQPELAGSPFASGALSKWGRRAGDRPRAPQRPEHLAALKKTLMAAEIAKPARPSSGPAEPSPSSPPARAGQAIQIQEEDGLWSTVQPKRMPRPPPKAYGSDIKAAASRLPAKAAPKAAERIPIGRASR